jgi:uncharacterized protein (TIGR03083 family)
MASASTRAGRLLLTEGGALLPLLRDTPAEHFDRPTVCPEWSVRDVLAHCSAALGMAVTGRFHGFTPEDNARDVAERAGWPIDRLLAELEGAYGDAAAAMDAAAGRLDGLALGEWVHGGDVRDALGRPGAWASAGLDDALALLVERSVERGAPGTVLSLTGPGPRRELTFGRAADADGGHGAEPGTPAPRLETDAATLVRLCAGRSPDPARYTLTGAAPEDYLLFR